MLTYSVEDFNDSGGVATDPGGLAAALTYSVEDFNTSADLFVEGIGLAAALTCSAEDFNTDRTRSPSASDSPQRR